jgi:hypothetical protein
MEKVEEIFIDVTGSVDDDRREDLRAGNGLGDDDIEINIPQSAPEPAHPPPPPKVPPTPGAYRVAPATTAQSGLTEEASPQALPSLVEATPIHAEVVPKVAAAPPTATRRKWLILVLVIAVVVLIAVVAGVVVWATTRSSPGGGSSEGTTTHTGNDDGSESTDDEVYRTCSPLVDSIGDCLATELTQVQASDCDSCVADGLKAVADGWSDNVSCSTINADMCPVLVSCGCGTCTETYIAFWDCVVDQLTTGCQLECTV